MSQKIRKPANKQIITREEERRDYKKEKVWLIEKSSGMICNRGEDFEKQQQNHDALLSPPSLQKHRLEEYPERPPPESKEFKNAGFWAHYTKPAQVYSQGSSWRLQKALFFCHRMCSQDSSGTIIWVFQVSVSCKNVYLLANHHTPVLWWYSIRGKPRLHCWHPTGLGGTTSTWLSGSLSQRATGQQGLMGPGWTA